MTFKNRYRPTKWDELVGRDGHRIASLIDGQDTPNFLFYGPPGTGKTSAARLVARELHGNERQLYELNASDDRGIETVRDKIHNYSRNMTLSGNPVVILLDEADAMTREAQQALRRPMEQHPATFILTANDVSAIHDAIKSRCFDGGIEFGALSPTAIVRRLEQIAFDLDVEIDPKRYDTWADAADGDMRVALDKLEQHVKFNPDDAEYADTEKARGVEEFITTD